MFGKRRKKAYTSPRLVTYGPLSEPPPMYSALETAVQAALDEVAASAARNTLCTEHCRHVLRKSGRYPAV